MNGVVMEKQCLNCGQPITSNYCSQCGQETLTKRIDWAYCSRELFYNNFTVHNKTMFTIKNMIIRPKEMITEYLQGKRVQYSGAIQFLFFILIIHGLIYVILGQPEDSDQTKLNIDIMGKIIDLRQYLKIIIVLFIILSAFGSRLVFRKQNYNFPEHLIINFYIISICWLLSALIKLVTWNQFPGYYSWVSLFFIIIYYSRVFRIEESYIRSCLKAIFCIFVIMIFVFMFILLGVGIIAGAYYLIH